jgi:hypothetical protein
LRSQRQGDQCDPGDESDHGDSRLG